MSESRKVNPIIIGLKSQLLKFIKIYITAISLWFWFVLVVTFVPLFFRGWLLCQGGDCNFIDACRKTISQGELLLISLSLLGGIIGDVLKASISNETVKITLIGSCFALTIWTSLVYSYYFAIPENILKSASNQSFSTSVFTFFLTLIVCSASYSIVRD